MRPAETLPEDAAALRERLSRLHEANLRVNESLDLNVVLREVVESARVLTGAGCGGITTLDDDGRLQEFISSGLSGDEHQQVLSLPDGQRVVECLSGVPETLRTPDLSEHVRACGFPGGPVLMKTFLGTPIRHRGRQVAHFYLGQKEGGLAFTGDDEEVLASFASQAATAIGNARLHRDEQKARADLETLIDTSPGASWSSTPGRAPVSFNRGARRIVEGLQTGDGAPERILETLTVRRADGRETPGGGVPGPGPEPRRDGAGQGGGPAGPGRPSGKGGPVASSGAGTSGPPTAVCRR